MPLTLNIERLWDQKYQDSSIPFRLDGAIDASAVNTGVISVKDQAYGAKGDGATNDTAAIQAAIDAAFAAGGGVVYAPPGTYLTGQLVLKNNVWLQGAGMNATILSLLTGTNASMIINQKSPDGIVADAQFCSITDLGLYGNKNNQSATSHGIWFDHWTTKATNDTDVDPYHYVRNVRINWFRDDGYHQTSRSMGTLHRVYVTSVNGNGFNLSFDTFLTDCASGAVGLAGFNVNNSNIMLTNCKAFFSGSVTPASGMGFAIGSLSYGTTLNGCIAQDNKAHGFQLVSTKFCALNGCIADSNSTSSANGFVGFDLFGAQNCTLKGCVAIERRSNGVNSYQTHAVQLRSTSTGNHIDVKHGAVNGATVFSALLGTPSSLTGNYIRLNSMDAVQSVAYAATITPDPYAGTTILTTLTGTATIANPSNAHSGCPLRFLFTQDATGGRNVNWGNQYVINAFNANTNANHVNTIDFVNDGTNWVQTGVQDVTHPGGAATGDLQGFYPDPSVAFYNPAPRHHGLLAWTIDPAIASSVANSAVAGTVRLIKMQVPQTITIGNLVFVLGTNGATLTNSFVGVYDSTGTLLGGSADISTDLSSGAVKTLTEPLTVIGGQSLTVTGGPSVFVWAAILVGSAVTLPQLSVQAGTLTAGAVNANLSLATSRVANAPTTGLTALPTSFTPSSITNQQGSVYFFGVS